MRYHVPLMSGLSHVFHPVLLAWLSSTAMAGSLLDHVPEARNYAVVYELDIPNTAAWNANAIPYAVDESANIDDGSFPRVAYYLELESGGTTNWVYVSMDTFTDDASLLGIPKTGSGGFFHFGNIGSVTNANIFSNVGGVTTGTGINTINLEFWSSNYGGGNQHGVAGANGGTFDFGDGGGGTGTGYGCMQIHNYGSGETLFAYNRWGSGAGELGIGNQPTGNPDWTFSNNVNAYTKRTLQVLVFAGGVVWSDPELTQVSASSADVRSELSVQDDDDAVAWLFWDTVDQGETATGWAFTNSLGTVSTGLVAATLSSLLSDTAYHYRFYATNSVVTNHGWSAPANLVTLAPGEWSGNQDDIWGNANNWAGGAIPDTLGESALFRGFGPGEVDLDGGSYSIGSLTFNAGDYRLVDHHATPGSLVVSSLLNPGGANTINVVMSIAGAAEVSGGTLTLLDAASITVPLMTLSGGTLGIEGDATALTVPPGASGKLIHTGYHGQNNDSNMDLHNNGGLMNMTPFGTAELTTGPADRGLDFNVDQDFINTGAIGQIDNYANLFIGYFIPPTTGTYGFRNAGDDDRAGIWLDLNRNGVFESTPQGLGSGWGEQLSWEDGGNKQVSLAAGLPVRIAFTHREGGGGSRCDFRFTTPSVAERIIKPADPGQAGLWVAALIGPDVIASGMAVDVSSEAAVRVTDAHARLGALTISNNVTLTTSGAQGAISFDQATLPAGATAIGIHADVDTVLTASSGLDGASANAVITKTGSGDLILDRAGSNLGSLLFEVQSGALAGVHAGAFAGAGLQLSGGELLLSSPGGDIVYDHAVAITSNSVLTAGRIGDGVAGPLNLSLSGNLTFLGDQTLALRSTDDYKLILPGEIVGNGILDIKRGSVTLSDTNFNAVTLSSGTLTVTNLLDVNALVQNGGAFVQAGANKDLTVRTTLTLVQDLDMTGANLDVSGATVNINSGTLTLDDPLLVDSLRVQPNGRLNVPPNINAITQFSFEPSQTVSNLLSGPASVILGDSELFTGFVALTEANTYTGETLIKRAVLRADEGVGLPVNSLLRFRQNNRDQVSIFATRGTFSRDIGTQPGEVFWESVGGGGGFAAEGGDLTVSLETNAALTWADADLGFNNTDSLQFGSADADSMVELANAIDLGNATRGIQIRDNNGRKGDFVRLSGVLSGTGADQNDRFRLNQSVGNNFIEGLLELTGVNTFPQSLTIDEGVVYAIEGVGLPVVSAIRFDQGSNIREGAFMSNGALNREIGTGPGEVRWDNTGGFAARGGDFVVTLESGNPLTWDNIDAGFGAANRRLMMGSRHADSMVDLVNDIALPADGQIMVFDNADTDVDVCKLSGVLSGTGQLRKVGGNDHRGGTLWLTGANTYSGRTFHDEGAIRGIDGVGLPAGSELYFEADSAARPCAFESSGAFTRNIGNTAGEVYWQGSGGFAAWGGLLNVNLEGGATLLWGNADTGFRGQQLLLGSRTANDIVTIENHITLDGNRVVRAFDNPHSDADFSVMSGDLRQDASNRQLQKFGDGRLDLTSTNNYIWTLRAREGVLNINGRHEGNYTQVHNGGTLGGNGELVLLDDLQVDAGGTLAPGTSVGTLTVDVDTGGDELRMLNGSTYAWELGSDNQGDRIDVIGNLRLDSTWTLSLQGGGGTPVASDEYTLFTYTESLLSSTTIDLVTSVVIDGSEVPVHWDPSGAVVKHDATGKRVYLTGLSSTLGIVNTAASDLMPTSATLNGLVSGTGETFSVTVYWGTSDQGTDAGSWDERMPLGQAIDSLAQPVFHPLAGLETNTLYHYTFRATNATTDLWATPSEPFTTLGPPRVDNGDGATNIKVGSARLQGGFLDHNRGNVTIVWGRSDAGTGSIGAWEHAEAIGPQSAASFSAEINGAFYPLTYVYRTYAVNPYGESWSDPAMNFTMNVNPKNLEVPVTDGLLAWFDAGSGVTTNASGVVQTWDDRSGNEHHATLQSGNPSLVPQAINTWPEVQTRGQNSYFDVAGNMFVKEQYVVGRSAGATWNNYGAFLANKAGRAGSYLFQINNTTYHGNQYPESVSRDGSTLASPFSLSPINEYMVLRVAVNNNNQTPRRYWLGRSDHSVADLDIVEVIAYDTVLSPEDSDKVGGYLAAKYDIPTSYIFVPPTAVSIVNAQATDRTINTATLNAIASLPSSVYDTWVYWGPANGGTNANSWAAKAWLGTYTNVAPQLLSHTIGGLTAASTDFYTFSLSNVLHHVWAEPSLNVLAVAAPGVDNSAGAVVNQGSAILQGNLTAGSVADIVVYWGTTDGEMTPGNWDHAVHLSDTPQGAFAAEIVAGYGFTYYYRCFASNAVGSAWASSTESFTFPPTVTQLGSGAVNYGFFDNLANANLAGIDDGVQNGMDAGVFSFAPSPQAAWPAQVQGKAIWTDIVSSTTMTDTYIGMWWGYFRPPVSGVWEFYVHGDDHEILWIDVDQNGEFEAATGEDISNNAPPESWNTPHTETVTLEGGQLYAFALAMHEQGGGDFLTTTIKAPGGVALSIDPGSASQAGWWSMGTTSSVPVLVNQPVSDVGVSSATLNASLEADLWGFDIWVHWGLTDEGVSGNWDQRANLGFFADVNDTVSYAISNLAVQTDYFYAFQATNALTDIWASPSTAFETLGPVAVANAPASGLTESSATLNGEVLSGGSGEVAVYWGTSDGGVVAGDWDHTNHLGEVVVGPFSEDLSVLASETYFYRSFVSNTVNTAWAGSSETFTTPSPGVALSLAKVIPNLAPTSFPNCILWLDASDIDGQGDGATGDPVAGQTVGLWTDRSASGNHADQGAESRQPLVVGDGLNGRPTLRFDGVDDYLRVNNESAFDVTTNLTIAVIARVDPDIRNWGPLISKRGEGGQGWQLRRHNVDNWATFTMRGPTGDNDPDLGHIPIFDTYRVFIAQYDGVRKRLWVDGQMEHDIPGTGPINNTDVEVAIAARYNLTIRDFAKADIAEVIVYDRALGGQELESLGCFLSAKYGLAATYATTISEDGGSAVVTATLSAPSAEDVTVNFGFGSDPFSYLDGLRGSVFFNTLNNQTPINLDDAVYAESDARVFTGTKVNTVLALPEDPLHNVIVTSEILNWNTFPSFNGAADNFVTAFSGRIFPRTSGEHRFRWNNDNFGQIFIDLDDNGVFDASERGVAGYPGGDQSGTYTLSHGVGGYNFIYMAQEHTGGQSINWWVTEPGGVEERVNPTAQAGLWRYRVPAATLGIDYTSSAPGVVIPAGSLAGNITLTSLDDNEAEEDEAVDVFIDSLVNAVNSAPTNVTIAITSDDPAVNPGGDDFDGDGIPDAIDPDDDNDGMSDEDEMIAGTDSLDETSFLYLLIENTLTPDTRTLIFPSVNGRDYFIRSRLDLDSGVWSPPGPAIPGDGSLKLIPDGTPEIRMYYQLGVELSPP